MVRSYFGSRNFDIKSPLCQPRVVNTTGLKMDPGKKYMAEVIKEERTWSESRSPETAILTGDLCKMLAMLHQAGNRDGTIRATAEP